MSEDESTLVEALDHLEAWDVAEPPDEFGARVLAAYDRAEADPVVPAAEPQAEPGSRRGWAWMAVAAVIGAAAMLVVVPGPPADARGSVTAEHQQTVAIAERATVVVQAGSALTWSTADDGGVRVEQPRGSAFYRVESGEAGESFAVHTPAGVVRVTGTCFAIDVQRRRPKMNTRTKAGAIGAALAAAVTVTVYEGSTVLANEAGTVEVGPGQRAVADADGAPRLQASADDTEPDRGQPKRDHVAALRAETHRQAAEIATLSRQLAEARGDVASADAEASDEPPARFAPMGPPIPEGFDHYQPTQEALLEMAECGIVAWDQPPVWADDPQLDPEYLAALDLSTQDAAVMQEVFDQYRADTVAEARQFYVELGGSPELAETIDSSELLGLVYGRTDFDARERERVAIAMERAGLAEGPQGELSPTESFLRWDAELGNRFEAALAERLGVERAQQLRAKRGGWSGKRTTWADLCRD